MKLFRKPRKAELTIPEKVGYKCLADFNFQRDAYNVAKYLDEYFKPWDNGVMLPIKKKDYRGDIAEMITEADWDSQKKSWKEKNPNSIGMKFSEGKPKWQYMDHLWPAMEEVVKVLTRGAEGKYSRNNWMNVDPEEYLRAIMSHYTAYASGEKIDPDMGYNHMANLICSALFLLWHDGIRREETVDEGK